MPRLWNETVEAHRRDVRDAIMTSAVSVVAEHGLRSATMSQIARATGIGRATLYKYFPDVETILVAWHERQVADHLEHLREVSDRDGTPGERLHAVLDEWASISLGHDRSPLAAILHRGAHVGRAEEQLRHLIRELVSEGAKSGELRADVPPDELVSYCLHAVAAVQSSGNKAAARRLVGVVMGGLRPEPSGR